MNRKTSALRAARKAAGLTQHGLGEIAGVGISAIHRLEAYPGFKPAPTTAQKLAAALGTTPEKLFPKSTAR